MTKTCISFCLLKDDVTVIQLTSNSLLFSIGFTLQIIFTTFLDSISKGSGDADLIDSAVSGEMARGLGVGG